jgi:hypothetical protein
MLEKMEFSAEKVLKNHVEFSMESDFLRKKMYEKSAPEESME